METQSSVAGYTKDVCSFTMETLLAFSKCLGENQRINNSLLSLSLCPLYL